MIYFTFHQKPKPKKKFSPIVVFRFILLAGSTVIELYYNMYGPRNDDIYLNILLQHNTYDFSVLFYSWFIQSFRVRNSEFQICEYFSLLVCDKNLSFFLFSGRLKITQHTIVRQKRTNISLYRAK